MFTMFLSHILNDKWLAMDQKIDKSNGPKLIKTSNKLTPKTCCEIVIKQIK